MKRKRQVQGNSEVCIQDFAKRYFAQEAEERQKVHQGQVDKATREDGKIQNLGLSDPARDEQQIHKKQEDSDRQRREEDRPETEKSQEGKEILHTGQAIQGIQRSQVYRYV